MPKLGSTKNFGWGNQIFFAGKNALRDHYGNGRYGTRATHISRWATVSAILREMGIRDTQQVTCNDLVRLAEILDHQVAQHKMQQSYAINLLSTTNITLSALRGDSRVQISPSDHLGARSAGRLLPPRGMDIELVMAAADKLNERGLCHVASVISFARTLGVRKREGCLLDVRQALLEAKEMGHVNITRGTKGGRGRYIDRWVPVSAYAIVALEHALQFQGKSKTLVPEETTLRQFIQRINRSWALVRDQFNLGKIHDLRACYACELYHEVTGFQAPVFYDGEIRAQKVADEEARRKIAYVLGHNRASIASAYIGGRR